VKRKRNIQYRTLERNGEGLSGKSEKWGILRDERREFKKQGLDICAKHS